MEDSDSDSVFGFNKRRAEGRDKTDQPKKTLQLKVRKLNPVNTISYVQVRTCSVVVFFNGDCINLCFELMGFFCRAFCELGLFDFLLFFLSGQEFGNSVCLSKGSTFCCYLGLGFWSLHYTMINA